MVLTHLRFALLAGAFVPLPAQAAVIPADVPVRVYDTTGIASPLRVSALDTARLTLGRTGASMAWLECAARNRLTKCEGAIAAGELILRIVHADGAGSVAPSGGAALRSRISPLPLGDAFVGRGSQSGVLATVYLDRVTALAEASGASVAMLLGYAIAHEIGHLLLGNSRHSARGLMRPLWSRDEVRRGRAADWTFTEGEAREIRARLASRRALAPISSETKTPNAQPPTPN